jgi:4-hydroxyphenylacetate 3-monooxygenase
MIRTGEEYRAGLRDGREVWIDGERVQDVTDHSAFKPVVDLKARMYDVAHEPAWAEIMSYREPASVKAGGDERCSLLLRPPTEKSHWYEKWRAVDAYLNDIRGILTRVGDETVGEMCSLYDGRDVLNEIDPRFGGNIDSHIRRVLQQDIFHVSANTDPKGDRSKRPQDQDPDMMVHVVKETDAGIVLRGAKYETAASYADQAFLKPTIATWTDEQLSDYAVGCIVRMGLPGSGISAARVLPAERAQPIIRSPTALTRSTHWSSSTMCWCRGRTCFFTATRAPPRASAAPCTAIRRSLMSCASSTPPI